MRRMVRLKYGSFLLSLFLFLGLFPTGSSTDCLLGGVRASSVEMALDWELPFVAWMSSPTIRSTFTRAAWVGASSKHRHHGLFFSNVSSSPLGSPLRFSHLPAEIELRSQATGYPFGWMMSALHDADTLAMRGRPSMLCSVFWSSSCPICDDGNATGPVQSAWSFGFHAPCWSLQPPSSNSTTCLTASRNGACLRPLVRLDSSRPQLKKALTASALVR